MAKLKDGFYKQTAEAIGSDLHVLLAGGGSKALSDFATSTGVVTALGTNGNYVTWTKNGTANNLTVPYATKAGTLDCFARKATANCTWGTLTASNGYTPIYWGDSASGGGIGFSDKGGQTFMQIDGDYYAQEGAYKVWHAGNLTKVSQLTNDAGYLTSLPSHTHSYVSYGGVVFTPANAELTSADVLALTGGWSMKKGTWDYAGNGYIKAGSFGNIDLAGTSILTFGGSSAYTQLFITAPTQSGHTGITNEMLFYNDHGAVYHPAWTRVLTNRNYNSYAPKLDGTGASGTWAIDISGKAADANTLDGIDSTGFLRQVTQNATFSSVANISTDLAPGIHSIHISGVEYSSILTGRDFYGSYWQLYFHPSSGYTHDIKYRATNCTTWKTLLDSNNWSSFITIPSVGNGTVTINQAGASKGSFTLNQSTAATIDLTDTNYYPTAFSWTGGTTAGPTGSLTGVGMSSVSFGAIPAASSTASGIVTTGNQSFSGQKTFNTFVLANYITPISDTTGCGIGTSAWRYYEGYFKNLYTNYIYMYPRTYSGTLYLTGLKDAPSTTSTVDSQLYASSYVKVQNSASSSAAVYAPGGFYESSDERLKNLLKPVRVNLDELSKLRKVYYTWKNSSDLGTHLGVIAQDVQRLYPELVTIDSETGYLSLSYDKLSVIALEAIDTLYKSYKELKRRVDTLEKLITNKGIL